MSTVYISDRPTVTKDTEGRTWCLSDRCSISMERPDLHQDPFFPLRYNGEEKARLSLEFQVMWDTHKAPPDPVKVQQAVLDALSKL